MDIQNVVYTHLLLPRIYQKAVIFVKTINANLCAKSHVVYLAKMITPVQTEYTQHIYIYQSILVWSYEIVGYNLAATSWQFMNGDPNQVCMIVCVQSSSSCEKRVDVRS